MFRDTFRRAGPDRIIGPGPAKSEQRFVYNDICKYMYICIYVSILCVFHDEYIQREYFKEAFISLDISGLSDSRLKLDIHRICFANSPSIEIVWFKNDY